jgi:hypothetical protein
MVGYKENRKETARARDEDTLHDWLKLKDSVMFSKCYILYTVIIYCTQIIF